MGGVWPLIFLVATFFLGILNTFEENKENEQTQGHRKEIY